jgi:pilus assembly protein TadC
VDALAREVGRVIAVAVVAALGILLLRRRRTAQVAASLREAEQLTAATVLDLVGVCVAAGLTAGAAVSRVVAAVEPPPWAACIDADLRAGVQLADALDAQAQVPGHEWLGRALAPVAAAARSGASVSDALDRTVERLRSAVRRSREERARRLPVTLLLPLTCCVLPAVMLVVVVPMLAQMLIGVS